MALVDSGETEYAIAFPDLGYNYYPVYSAFGGYLLVVTKLAAIRPTT